MLNAFYHAKVAYNKHDILVTNPTIFQDNSGLETTAIATDSISFAVIAINFMSFLFHPNLKTKTRGETHCFRVLESNQFLSNLLDNSSHAVS